MNEDTKTKLIARATAAKNKAFAAFAWCKAKIASTWKSGRKGKAICIGGAAVVLLLLMQCGGGSESDAVEDVASGAASDATSGGGRGTAGVGNDGIGRDGTYNGEALATVFKGIKDDEGVIYNGGHVDNGLGLGASANYGIKVVQATSEGNLVENEGYDRPIWVETQKRYLDGQALAPGFYVRRGSYEYAGFGGIIHTVARYVEVTDKGLLEKLQKQADAEEAAKEKARREEEAAEEKARREEQAKAEAEYKAKAEAKAKAELEAEGKPVKVNATVESLCGFAIGATPSSVTNLFKKDCWSWNGDRTGMEGELATPFRHFDRAELVFSTRHPAGGKHLAGVELSAGEGENSPLAAWEADEYSEEIKSIVVMLQKKFGIKFRKTIEDDLECEWEWETKGGDDCVWQKICIRRNNRPLLQLIFESDLLSAKESKALKEVHTPKPAKLSSDAGVDRL